jgi:hypothetical protein
MLQGSMMVMLTDWPADLILLADADARFIWGFKLHAHMCLKKLKMHVSINNTTISLSRSSQGIRIDQEEEWKKRVFRHMHVTEARMPDWDLEMPTEFPWSSHTDTGDQGLDQKKKKQAELWSRPVLSTSVIFFRE